MTDPYVDFFLNSRSDVVQYETVEISHPNFSRTFYIVRNNQKGIVATLETGQEKYFEYCPLRIEQEDTTDDLDYGFTVSLGDLGELLPQEFDRINAANGFQTKPAVKYRTYRSDDLSTPIFGPVVLQLTEIAFNKEGCSFTAIAPRLNLNRTGMIYRIVDFPMMRGFLE